MFQPVTPGSVGCCATSSGLDSPAAIMTHRFRLDDGIIRIPPWDYSAMRSVVQRSRLTAKQRAEIRPWAEAGYADSQYL